jgi:hypothetical protein
MDTLAEWFAGAEKESLPAHTVALQDDYPYWARMAERCVRASSH